VQLCILDTTFGGAYFASLQVGQDSACGKLVAHRFESMQSQREVSPFMERHFKQILVDARHANVPTEVWVAVGPGSFTGIKIGMAFVSGLITAASHRFAVYGFHSLQFVADYLAHMHASPVIVFLKATRSSGYFARKSEVFAELGRCDLKSESVSLSMHFQAGEIERDFKEHKLFVIGEWNELECHENMNDIVLERLNADGDWWLKATLFRFADNDRSALIQPFIPNYIRASAPEEKLAIR
jgi:tRNA A37 threonylcarbamoyladenosine modification protein TsaB